ncbi:hypothetical protein [Kiloniella antarctica]|uniref:Uncharacterized protein n=1 Tax=Kiloniella antarctica TaxID=1550907 RepID=A0ABW5BKZ7_9PROT
MLKNWWIIGAISLIIIIAYSSFTLFSPKEIEVNQRQQIHSAIADFGNLTDLGVGQVEILSDTEIRFLITGGQAKEELDNNLKKFCRLLITYKHLQVSDQPFELAYQHRQIPAISGNYTCKDDS